MPKKMGTNSKAVEARERKQAAKQANQEKAIKEKEDKLWQDDDKNLAKKKARKEEEDRKKAEAAKKKAEAKALLDAEMASIRTQGKPAAHKITRLQIQDELDKKNRNVELLNSTKVTPKVTVINEEAPIEQNLNRIMQDVEVASNVDEAIKALSINDGEDKHPEKRMRAAFKAFEAANLPRIKDENPNLRLSQWKQILMKEWNKSPDNPFNQRI